MSRPIRPVPASCGRIYTPVHDSTSLCREGHRGKCVVLFVLSISLLALAAVVLLPPVGKVIAVSLLLVVILRAAFLTGHRGLAATGRF